MLAVGHTANQLVDLGTAVSAVDDDGTANDIPKWLQYRGYTILKINQALGRYLVVWVFLQVKELVKVEVTT